MPVHFLQKYMDEPLMAAVIPVQRNSSFGPRFTFLNSTGMYAIEIRSLRLLCSFFGLHFFLEISKSESTNALFPSQHGR